MLDLKFSEMSKKRYLVLRFIDEETCSKCPAQHHMESQRFHLKSTIIFSNTKYLLIRFGLSENCMRCTCEGDKPWKIRKQTPQQVKISI